MWVSCQFRCRIRVKTCIMLRVNIYIYANSVVNLRAEVCVNLRTISSVNLKVTFYEWRSFIPRCNIHNLMRAYNCLLSMRIMSFMNNISKVSIIYTLDTTAYVLRMSSSCPPYVLHISFTNNISIASIIYTLYTTAYVLSMSSSCPPYVLHE